MQVPARLRAGGPGQKEALARSSAQWDTFRIARNAFPIRSKANLGWIDLVRNKPLSAGDKLEPRRVSGREAAWLSESHKANQQFALADHLRRQMIIKSSSSPITTARRATLACQPAARSGGEALALRLRRESVLFIIPVLQDEDGIMSFVKPVWTLHGDEGLQLHLHAVGYHIFTAIHSKPHC